MPADRTSAGTVPVRPRYSAPRDPDRRRSERLREPALRVLLSAYACAPDWGSEPEIGWQTLRAAASRHDVWVLTQPRFVPLIEQGMAGEPWAGRVHLEAVPPDMPEATGMAGHLRIHAAHDRWQRRAARRAAALHERVRFDVVHHCTLAAYWVRIGVAAVDAPLVLGPVGGAVNTPLPLLPELGARGLAEELTRRLTRRLIAAAPPVRRSRRGAAVVLTQNRETARRFRRPRPLPNALCVDLTGTPAPPARTPTVVHAARLVPWKGTRLAVRAMRHVRAPVSLEVYGDGPEAERLRRAARRWGVEHRVRLHGSVDRAELVRRLAQASAVLHPSLHDEGSTVTAEALTLGTPSVCLDHGGPPEVHRHWPQVRSVAVPVSTPERTARALAAALDEVLAAGTTLEPVQKPSVDYAASVLDVYEDAARSAPASAR